MPKGFSPSPETRALLSLALKGKKRTPEQVERIRAGAKRTAAARMANPDTRKKMSQTQKQRLSDPAERARVADCKRRAFARNTVLAAGLPLWRHLVERAMELRRILPKTRRREDIVEILRSEFARKQAA